MCSNSTSAYDNLPSTAPLPYIDSSLIDPIGTDLLSLHPLSDSPSSTDPPSSLPDPPSSSTDPPSLLPDPLSSSTDPPSSSTDPPSSLPDPPSSSTDPPLLVNAPVSSNKVNLPKSLSEFFIENCKQSDQNILEKAKQIFYSLHLQEEQCVAVEKATRSQRKSVIWHQQRHGRLTASSFHSVISMKKQTDPQVVAGRLIKHEDLSYIPAVKWGLSKEDDARQAYVKEMSYHQDFSCTKSGLVINPLYPHPI